MNRFVALLAGLLLLPALSHAATLRADASITVDAPSAGNAYLAASDLRILADIAGDLVAAAGNIDSIAKIGGDALLAAGTLTLSGPVEGDARLAGGRVTLSSDVSGELAALAGNLVISGKAGEIRAAGGNVEIRAGANGPVTVYAGTVTLAGEFAGDVTVVASDRVMVAEGTVIQGALEYNAPQEASLPATATVVGGVRYVGSASFLPTEEEAKTFALAGLGIFFLVRMVAAMLAAGLVAGLFPEFSRRVAHEALGRSLKRFIILALLGFATVVAVPVLVLLLLASFVGIAIAALLGALYVLMLMLAYLYAALLAGSLFSHAFLKRPGISWRSAAFGMLVLYVLGLIPVFGFAVSSVLAAAALGAIIATAYRFAFGRAGIE